jgi:hypothetical protein
MKPKRKWRDFYQLEIEKASETRITGKNGL